MEIEKYLSYLDDLTHEERSVFFYRFIFNRECKEITDRLKLSSKRVARILKMLQEQKELLLIKEYLIEQFSI